MIKEQDVYRIGRIGKAHGVKGEVQMQFTDDAFDRVDADYLILMTDGILVPFFMEEYRFKSDEVALVKFCDVDTQEQARELTGCDVYFPYALVEEEEDAMPSLAQLVGYTIVDQGKAVGTVASIDEQTVNTLFELTDGQLIPVAAEFILGIDNEKREIITQLPEGLLNL